MQTHIPWRRLGAALAVTLSGATFISATATPAAAALPAGGMTAAAVATMFNTYGDAGNHWTGGDSTVFVPLPDGRVAWLFSDTFLGTVNADGSRPRDTPMVNNTVLIQEGTAITATRHGGTAALPEALVKPSQAGEFYWVGDGTVEGGNLKVIYNRFKKTGTGSLDFAQTGSALVTFALPALTVSSIVDLPVSTTIGWGSAILEDGAYTYVYGTSSADGFKFAHVARAAAGAIGGAWQFWTGTAWSATESQAARVLSGVGTGFGVQLVNGQYVLVTQENNRPFDPQMVAYTASSPTGPFTGPVHLLTAPEQAAGSAAIVYDARLHPELARSGKLLVSYNVNSLSNDDNYTDARLYRPRFVEVDWPRPVPAPSSLPATPGGFTATVDAAGVGQLAWQAVSGATGYRIHQRDETAGQDHFARLPAAVTGTSTQIGALLNGHRYEFKVTAENAVGEGTATAVLAVVPQIVAPPAPTGVTVTADSAGQATVRWSAVAATWTYDVYDRDVTAGETDFSSVAHVAATATSKVLTSLENGHTYEIYVIASHGGGDSPPSATVTATATYAMPGAPTGLTATARSDGQIALSWTAPGANLYYWVYQRDVTAAETEFTQLPIPIAGTSMTAGLLTDGHTYEYKVTAINRAGEGPASALVRAVSAYPASAPPTGLTAAAGDGEVELTWTASTTAGVWYWVYQRDVTAGETTFTQLPLPVSVCCTMTPGWLTNGHTYEYKVTSIGPGGESAPTAVVSATPNVPLPGQVTGLTVVPNADGTLKVSWTSPGGNVWFDVYMRDVTAGEATFTKLGLPVTTCCTFDAGWLTNNHVYEYKVAAINSAGAGPLSAAARGTAHFAAPAAPPNLRGESSGDGMIALDWDSPGAGGFYYWIYYRDVSAGQTTFTKSGYPTDKTAIELGPYVNGHDYEFKITAENSGGEGPASNTVKVTSRGGTPVKPTGLTATAGNGEVALSWTASTTPSVLYNVYTRDDTAGASWKKLDTPVSVTKMTAGYLTNGHTYSFKVTAVNASGASAASNVATAKPMPPTPAAPSGLTAGAGDGKVTLRWTASSTPGVFYWIETRANGGGWQRSKYPLDTCCTFTQTLLTNGTTYEFHLLAENLAGFSSASNVASAKPMPPIPAAPTGLSATAGDGKVTLKWTASTTGSVWYWVEMRAKGSGWQRLKWPVSTCCSFPITGLVNGTTYEFRMFSTNLAGDSGASNTDSAKPLPPFPDAPHLLGPVTSTDTVNLAWEGSTTSGVYYRIYYRNATRGQSKWIAFPWPTQNTYAQLYGIFVTGEAYDFQIAAVNAAGENASNYVTAVPRRFLASSSQWRPTNEANGSNMLAGLWALAHGWHCQPDYRQVVCFGSPPTVTGQSVTVGDYLFFNGTPAQLELRVASNTLDRATILRTWGAATAHSKGPDLLRHEAVHSEQWSKYVSYSLFIADYALASHNGLCQNRFELEANLYWGGYHSFLHDNGDCD